LKRSYSEQEAVRLASRLTGGIFALYVLAMSWRAWDGDGLLRACAYIALGYLLIASPGYWPWYATLPIALMALSPHGILRWIIFVLALCSRLVAPIDDMAVNGFTTWMVEVWSTPVVATGVPLLTWLLLGAGYWLRRAWPRMARARQSGGASI
jgi:alpha-1,6-mannosyltransferase